MIVLPTLGELVTQGTVCALHAIFFFFHFAMLLPTPEKICHQRLLVFFFIKKKWREEKKGPKLQNLMEHSAECRRLLSWLFLPLLVFSFYS